MEILQDYITYSHWINTLLPFYLVIIFIFISFQREYLSSNHSTKPFSFKNALNKKFTFFFLFLLILIAGYERTFTFAEAYEPDIPGYMQIATKILSGDLLYREAWDHKPPGIYIAYSIFTFIFGSNPFTVWVMGYSLFVFTFIGLFVLAREVGGTLSGTIAASIWTLFNADLLLQGNQPNAEVFMNGFLVYAIYFFMIAFSRKNYLYAIYSGFFFFLATFFKMVVVVIPVLIVILYLFDRNAAKSSFLHKLGLISAIALTSALGWILVFAYFYINGTFKDFWNAVFIYNQYYSGNLISNLLNSFKESRFSNSYTPYLFAFFLIIASGAFIKNYHYKILLGYLIGAWVSIALPGQGFGHYYQLLIPVISIGLAWISHFAWSYKNISLFALVLISILAPTAGRYLQLKVPDSLIPRFKYGLNGYSYIECMYVAKWVNDYIDEDDVMFFWGDNPAVYFWSNRISPVSSIFGFHLLRDNPISNELTERTLNELSTSNPKLIIIRSHYLNFKDHPVMKWINDNYTPTNGPDNISFYTFLLKK